MPVVTMRAITKDDIPDAGGTALQSETDRPVFNGNGPNDYACGKCGTILATNMHSFQMTRKLRIKCAGCETINVAVQEDAE